MYGLCAENKLSKFSSGELLCLWLDQLSISLNKLGKTWSVWKILSEMSLSEGVLILLSEMSLVEMSLFLISISSYGNSYLHTGHFDDSSWSQVKIPSLLKQCWHGSCIIRLKE